MFPLFVSVFYPNEVHNKDSTSFFCVLGYTLCKRAGRILKELCVSLKVRLFVNSYCVKHTQNKNSQENIPFFLKKRKDNSYLNQGR